MDVAELHKQVAPNFIFTGSEINNPITCVVNIWDKKSDAKITATVDLELIN